MLNQFKIFITLAMGLITGFNLIAQQVQLLSPGPATSIRGLSVVDDRVIWVSGSNGKVGRSLDSGNTFQWITVHGFEKTDFRDIEAFSETAAVIMGIAAPAYLLKTSDGGSTWKVVFENKDTAMFLDAMEFWNEHSGIVIGDPVQGKFFVARTFNGGISWKDIPTANYPVADSGEACFASSGTNIRALNQQEAVFVSGGLKSNLFIRDKKYPIPIIQGTSSTGANSIAVKNKELMMVVGGDFNNSTDTTRNCYITFDGGQQWQSPVTPPNGYRSCVEYLDKKRWITCGLNGIDISTDDGLHWTSISSEGFHVCRKAKKGKAVFFAGGGGRIAKLVSQ